MWDGSEEDQKRKIEKLEKRVIARTQMMRFKMITAQRKTIMMGTERDRRLIS